MSHDVTSIEFETALSAAALLRLEALGLGGLPLLLICP